MSTHLVMYRGDDRDFPLTITAGGAALDLTGATVVFTARSALTDTDATFSLSSAVVGEITIAADQVADKGEITVHVPASATEDVTGTLLCDVEVTTSAGKVLTWPEATYTDSSLIRLKVRADVTHA